MARGPLLLAAALLAACTTPPFAENGDLAVELSARALPGVGAGIGLVQRMNQGPTRVDVEAGLELQQLSDEGPRGDDWARLWAGLRCSPAGAETPALACRLGLNWARADADPPFLDGVGDYGGFYLGLAFDSLQLGRWRLGPDLEVLLLDSEGSRNRWELAAQVAFHFRRLF